MTTRFEWDSVKQEANRRKHRNPVQQSIDPGAPPPLTEAQEAETAALAAKPDDAIDTSDIPALPDTFWQRATRGRFDKPGKPRTAMPIT